MCANSLFIFAFGLLLVQTINSQASNFGNIPQPITAAHTPAPTPSPAHTPHTPPPSSAPAHAPAHSTTAFYVRHTQPAVRHTHDRLAQQQRQLDQLQRFHLHTRMFASSSGLFDNGHSTHSHSHSPRLLVSPCESLFYHLDINAVPDQQHNCACCSACNAVCSFVSCCFVFVCVVVYFTNMALHTRAPTSFSVERSAFCVPFVLICCVYLCARAVLLWLIV